MYPRPKDLHSKEIWARPLRNLWAKVGHQRSPCLPEWLCPIFLPLSAIGSEAVHGKLGLTAEEGMDLRAHIGFRCSWGPWSIIMLPKAAVWKVLSDKRRCLIWPSLNRCPGEPLLPWLQLPDPLIWLWPAQLWMDHWVLVLKGTSASFNDLLSVTLVKGISNIITVFKKSTQARQVNILKCLKCHFWAAAILLFIAT